MKKRWKIVVCLGLAFVMGSQPVLAAVANQSSQAESSFPADEWMEDEETIIVADKNSEEQNAGLGLLSEEEAQVDTMLDMGSDVDEKITTEIPMQVSETKGESSAEKTVEELEELVAEGLDINPANVFGLGSTVTLKGKTNDEARENATYRYIYLYNNNWYVIEASDHLEEVEWTPEKVGDYLVAFQILYKEQTYNYFAGVQVDQAQITVNSISTEMKDSAVLIEPEVTANVPEEQLSYTYQIYDLKKGTWHTLQADTAESTCKWEPDKAGTYWIHVTVEVKAGNTSSYTIGYVVNEATITDFYMDVEPQQLYTKTITLTGEVEKNSKQTLTYEYIVYDGAYWKCLSREESLDSCEFTAEKPGTYLLCFQIYDEDGTVLGQRFLGYEAQDAVVNVQDIRTEIIKEKEICLNVTAESNTKEVEYRWLYYDLKNSVWGEIEEWSESKKITWNAPDFGTYWIHVEARPVLHRTNVVSYTIGYEVEPFETKLTNMQVDTEDYATYYIQQNVETNDPTLTYKYLIYDLKTKEWSELSQIGTKPNTYWKPIKSGVYWIHAIVTSSNGDEFTNTIGIQVKGYMIQNFGFADRLEVGKTNQLSVTGTNVLNEDYTFTYMQWDNNGGWDILYEGSEEGTVEWTAHISGHYALLCQVTNKDGEVIDSAQINLTPKDFMKNGWYYEKGFKFYYIDNVKQLDLDSIIGYQSSYMIKVNRTTCTVTVYAADGANGYIIPVKRFACSVGLPETPTPIGSFYTSNKFSWGKLMGPSYGQYCTVIVGGIYFHSVASTYKNPYNLNPANYNKLGSPASHGCVRLCVKDAKWIYDHCKLQTLVTIYDSSDPGPLGYGPVYRITNPYQNYDPTDTFENPYK